MSAAAGRDKWIAAGMARLAVARAQETGNARF